MTEGSLFAGIMGFGEGFRRAGFRNLWAVEIEPFCQAVIRTRFPETKVFKDVNGCGKHNLEPVDVITAGFPCQDLSVAGKRAGLEGSRSGLFWQVVRILEELKPPWVVIENVPGLFSSNEGRDFAVVLNALDELGYGLAWRVLDSQHFGVAQRRRRVFIVGRFGEPCPREVLFESESGTGDFAESGKAGEGTAEEATRSVAGPFFSQHDATGGWMPNAEQSAEGYLQVTTYAPELAPSRTTRDYRGERVDVAEPSLVATLNSGGNNGGFRTEPGEHIVISGRAGKVRTDPSDSSTGSGGTGIRSGGPMHSLDGSPHAVAYQLRRDPGGTGQGWNTNYAISPPLTRSIAKNFAGSGNGNDGVGTAVISSPTDANRVRDFTGLPQGLDSARYRALGNAVTVSVAQWIGERILKAAAETTWGPFALNQGMESD